MRIFIFILIVFAFAACNKDKFTTVPQIKFKEFKPDNGNSQQILPSQPYVIFELTDGEGDIGDEPSKVFIRNTLTNQMDSFNFPDLSTVAGQNFKGDIQVGLFRVMGGSDVTPGHPAPFVDTMGFEIYVLDEAKNKSNVVIASPFYYYTL